jgi:Tryptophan-associated transmembrane protein (Trp_oprn_chp).
MTERPPLRRVKYTSMLATVAGSGLALLGATQGWYTLHLTTSADHSAAVVVQGSTAAPALTALALAGLALTAALAIAGRVARMVLGVLGVLIGGCVLFSAFTAIADPVRSGASAVTTVTGVAGDTSVAHLVERVDASVWPWVTVTGGVLLVLANIAVLATSARWPGASRRYQAVAAATPVAPALNRPDATEQAEAAEQTDAPEQAEAERPSARDAAIDSWDELSRGEDPTR